MAHRFTPDQSHEASPGDANLAEGAPRPSPIATWLLLIGGGFMAVWGALVTLGLLVVLFIQGPGPGGPVPFFLGGVVIGLFPIGFGSAVFWLARQRRRQTRMADTGSSMRP